MGESSCREVDRLAARRILDRLKIKVIPEIIEEVAAELAEHRKSSEQWAAGRAQSEIIRELEERSMQDFGRMCEDWANGFRAAEELVATLSLAKLLGQPIAGARSKGQVLRSMVRDARKRSALIERRSR